VQKYGNASQASFLVEETKYQGDRFYADHFFHGTHGTVHSIECENLGWLGLLNVLCVCSFSAGGIVLGHAFEIDLILAQ
jgi:hypothetical protein